MKQITRKVLSFFTGAVSLKKDFEENMLR